MGHRKHTSTNISKCCYFLIKNTRIKCFGYFYPLSNSSVWQSYRKIPYYSSLVIKQIMLLVHWLTTMRCNIHSNSKPGDTIQTYRIDCCCLKWSFQTILCQGWSCVDLCSQFSQWIRWTKFGRQLTYCKPCRLSAASAAAPSLHHSCFHPLWC